MPGGRRPLSTPVLQETARIVNAHPFSTMDAIAEIRARFGIAQSTAFRYIQRARQKGFLREEGTGMPDKVEEIFAFVMTAEDGNEGVPAFFTEQGWIPLIGADMERIDLLRKAAQDIATSEARPIKLIKFAGPPEVLEVIEP